MKKTEPTKKIDVDAYRAAAAILGALGGASKSKRKVEAARRNGRKNKGRK